MENYKNDKLKKSLKEVRYLSYTELMELSAELLSGIVEEIIRKYGKEGLYIVKKAVKDSWVKLSINKFKNIEDRSVSSYKKWIITTLDSETKYEIIEDKKDSVLFKFTDCTWANAFKAIGKPEIGYYLFCANDGPLVKAFNKNISFERTKTLMEGDDFCNHHFFIKK